MLEGLGGSPTWPTHMGIWSWQGTQKCGAYPHHEYQVQGIVLFLEALRPLGGAALLSPYLRGF